MVGKLLKKAVIKKIWCYLRTQNIIKQPDCSTAILSMFSGSPSVFLYDLPL